MNHTINYAIFFMLVMSIIFFAADSISFGVQYVKSNELSKESIRLAERYGGYTPAVESEINKKIDKLGLDKEIFKVTTSTNGIVNFKGTIKIKVSGEYTFKAFNFLGTGIGNVTIPINVEKTGYSDVLYRN